MAELDRDIEDIEDIGDIEVVEIPKRKTNKFLSGFLMFLAFFAPVVIMLAIFIGNSIYPFGDRSFAISDMYHQYVPFFQEFERKVRAGESLDYSWNVGMGSNFTALYGYYLASPFHWLAFLFPISHLMEFVSYLVVFKIGLTGLFAFLYLRSRGRREASEGGWKEGEALPRSISALLFSCFYAMSGYVAAYNYNIMWLDCILLAPLVLMGLERLVKQGRMELYIISLGICIFTNFYISIMICLFLVLYFLFLFLTEPKKLRMLWQFTVASLLAGALAAVLLIPEVFALLATDFGDMSFPTKWNSYFSIMEVLARHCMGITVEKALEHWPNIYCGSAVFLFVPLYAMNEGIPAKKRFGFLALAGLFLISFAINGLDFIWHGFNYPDSLPARQSFLYILIVLVMCHDCLTHMERVEGKSIIKAYLGTVIALLAVEKFLQSDDFHTWDWLMTLGFVTVYAICLYYYRTRNTRLAYYVLAMVSFVFVLAECAVNMSLTSVATISRTSYYENVADYTALYERYAPTEDFQRFEKYTRKTKNDATLAGFPSASVFSSTMNSYVMDFYTRLGMRHSKVFYGYDGATAFSSALLNVGYLYAQTDGLASEIYERKDQENEIYLYEAKYKLPFGYVAPTGFDLPEGLKYNGISIQNKLAEELGAEGILLQKMKAENVGDDVEYTPSTDGIYYGLVLDYGTTKIKLTGLEGDDYEFKDLKKDCILFLGQLKKDQTITLTNGDKDDKTPKVSVAVYRLNTEVLEQAIESLGREHLTDLKMSDKRVSGRLSLARSGRLITSIPYEKGWKVTVNGERSEVSRFGTAFIAIDLGPGEYEIEMEYAPEGKSIGFLVSLVSLIGGASAGMIMRILRKKDKPKRMSLKTFSEI